MLCELGQNTLNISDLTYKWPGQSQFEIAVSHLSIATGETVLLLGQSGSGKSTLLSLICGTLKPNSGRIDIGGTNITSMTAAARDTFRANHIGVIFQQFNLLPFGRVIDNILLPLKFAPDRRKSITNPADHAAQLCAALGLPQNVGQMKAHELSVGQQQRVAVARALIGAPPLIVADEPTSALDADSQAAFLDVLFSQCVASGSSLLMVSHDRRLADRFDRVINLEDIATVTRGAQ